MKTGKQLKESQESSNCIETANLKQVYNNDQNSTTLLNMNIPSVKEWYQLLSAEDKQLCLSIINQELIGNLIKMLVKCREEGQGVFKLIPALQNSNSDISKAQQQPSTHSNFIKSEHEKFEYLFEFQSVKSLIEIKNQSAQLLNAKTNILEKELLDYVRFTYTEKTDQAVSISNVSQMLNTMCLSGSIIHDNGQFFELAEKIVGTDFISINLCQNQEVCLFEFPSWLNLQEYHTPAKWFLAIFEMSINYHYSLFTQGLINDHTALNSTLQIENEKQLIHTQNKIFEIIEDLKYKYENDQKVLFGLIQKCEEANIQQISMIIALFMNQKPQQLATDLCLTSIYKLQTLDFESEREFINLILIMTQAKASESQKKAIKNQKKKNKRKQKKAQQKEQKQSEDLQEEEKQPIQVDPQYQQLVDQGQQDFKQLKDDFHQLNIQKQKRKESHKEPRDHLEYQDIFSDSIILQLLDHEGNKENDRSPHNERLDKLSSFSDSTVDILGNFSSENFKNRLKSPQHSTNTEIELDIRKNLYSSDAGDSSILMQKQFSDFCCNKDSSNINIDTQNQTKTKESIDTMQIDVSISIDNTIRQDDSARNKSGKKVTLQLPQHQQQQYNEPQNNFQIIRSAPSYFQQQQLLKQNQRKKKNRNSKKSKAQPMMGGNNQQQYQSSHQKQMNNFIRNILQHQEHEEEEYDEYGQEEAYEQSKADNTTRSNISSTNNKKQTIYVKKSAQSTADMINPQAIQKDIIKNNDNSINQFKSPVSQGQNLLQENQKNVQSQQSFTEPSKKKKNYKSKNKSNNWDKSGNNKKKGKSKGSQPSQGQLNKQHSYDPQYNLGFGLPLNRQSSMYDNQMYSSSQDLLNPLLGSPTIDIEEFKHMLQQTIIQDNIQKQIQAQQQQELMYQQNPNQNDIEATEDQDCEENLDEEQLTDLKQTEAFFELLEKQMINYQKQIERKLESVRKERETAIQIIRNIVANLYKDERNSVAVKLYGSMASNLSIDTSDVDLAVVGLDFSGNRDRQIIEMRKLVEQINLIMKKSTSLKFIETATVPVIKLEIDLVQIARSQERNEKNEFGKNAPRNIKIDEGMRYLGVDITFEDTIKQHYYGVHVDNLSRINLGIKCINYIKELCKDMPGLQTIVLILKKLLQVNDLNQTFTGGLNSYSIVLMTTAYLKQFNSVQSISKNLMEFFNFYGKYFDPKSTFISSHQFPHFVKYSLFINEPMIIQDPLDPNNNPAKGAYQIGKIQAVFNEAYQVLLECLNQFKQSQSDIQVIDILMNHSSYLNQIQSIGTNSQ